MNKTAIIRKILDVLDPRYIVEPPCHAIAYRGLAKLSKKELEALLQICEAAALMQGGQRTS